MSGETAEKESGWTVDTLMTLALTKVAALEQLVNERDTRYSQRFTAQQEALVAALAAAKEAVASALLAADRAVGKAEEATRIRFESFNEFNARMDNLTRTFPTRELMDAAVRGVEVRVAAVELWRAQQVGAEHKGDATSRTQLTIAGFVVAAVIAAVESIILVLRH